MSHQKLTLAIFGFYLYAQEILWLALNRFINDGDIQFYFTSDFVWQNFLKYSLLILFFSFTFALLVIISRPSKRLSVSIKLVKFFVFLTASILVLKAGVVHGDARYTSGGLTGFAGIVYFASNALFLMSVIILFKARLNEVYSLNAYSFILLFSYSITIDGLAPALTLLCSTVILFNLFHKNLLGLIFLLSLMIALLYLGVQAKWTEAPDYLTPHYFVSWVLSRFSIQSEQFYYYISGDSYISSFGDYVDLLVRAFNLRLDVIFQGAYTPIYPRSVSESIYYDMKGEYFSGSSPGIALGTAHLMLGFFVFQYFVVLIVKNIFMGNRLSVRLWMMVPVAFLLKPIYTDSSEFFALISPILVYALSIYFASIVRVKLAIK
jgi:hypothetical protein